MAGNNLRIVYNNLADLSTTTITADSSATASTPVANLKNDFKSKVWRSTGAAGSVHTKMVLIVDLGTTSTALIGAIVLPFCNISQNATITVKGYSNTGTAPTITGAGTTTPTATAGTATLVFNRSMSAAPYRRFGYWNWGTQPLGSNVYSYGGGTYARCYIPVANQFAARFLSIEIVDNDKADPYFEVAKLVVGQYWSPKYNTSFGLSAAQKDTSQHSRTEAGDLVTNRGIRYNSLNFDLKYMDPTDRSNFIDIVKGNGLPRPMFISLFPEDTDTDKELIHQIYGKLSQLSAVQHPIYEIYSTQIDIEEI